MSDTPSPLTQSLEDILLELGPITSVSYEPFKCEPKQIARDAGSSWGKVEMNDDSTNRGVWKHSKDSLTHNPQHVGLVQQSNKRFVALVLSYPCQ
jgi:hypothetical protein